MPDSQTGLTTMERALCEAIIADPDRNVTRASKGIYRGGPGAVWKALKRPRVKAYLAKLENAARELAEQKTGEVIASRAEVLARLTRQSRLRLEDYFETEIDPAGGVTFRPKPGAILKADGMIEGLKYDARGNPEIRFASPQAANKALLEHHDKADHPEDDQRYVDNRTLIVNIASDPDKLDKAMDVVHDLLRTDE